MKNEQDKAKRESTAKSAKAVTDLEHTINSVQVFTGKHASKDLNRNLNVFLRNQQQLILQ